MKEKTTVVDYHEKGSIINFCISSLFLSLSLFFRCFMAIRLELNGSRSTRKGSPGSFMGDQVWRYFSHQCIQHF